MFGNGFYHTKELVEVVLFLNLLEIRRAVAFFYALVLWLLTV